MCLDMLTAYNIYKLLLLALYSFIVYLCYHDGSLGSHYGDLLLWLLLIPTLVTWIASIWLELSTRLVICTIHGTIIGILAAYLVVSEFTASNTVSGITIGAVLPALPVVIEAAFSIDFLKQLSAKNPRRLF